MEPIQPQPDTHVDNIERVTQNLGGSTQPVNDTWLVRLVVIGIAAIVLTVVIASTVLALRGDKQLPDSLQTLGAVGTGALAALLASTASRRQ